MELLERSRKLDESRLRNYSRKIGPLWGGLLGAIPQCGISGAAATLFSTGTITVGTMLAVFFATSDEMLPIMISSLFHEKIRLTEILLILLSKALLGIFLGFLTDWTVGRFFRSNKNIHSFCEREHCECDEGESSVWHSALHHTLKIAILLIVVGFVLNLLLRRAGASRFFYICRSCSARASVGPNRPDPELFCIGLHYRGIPVRYDRPERPFLRPSGQQRDRSSGAAAHQQERQGKSCGHRSAIWLKCHSRNSDRVFFPNLLICQVISCFTKSLTPLPWI